MKKLTVGMLAHVDAGKTTLIESILYLGGVLKTPGRVDHGDAYLDTESLEKERGITIFSKQAVMDYKDLHLSILDTPGHVDFSSEMERTLQVLDYAVLVVSASDGIQSHTATLWKLLEKYGIPAFLFINKTDLTGDVSEKILKELNTKLGGGFVNFSRPSDHAAFCEDLAENEEDALNEFLDTGELTTETIGRLIRNRKVFPCYFGSALKNDGVDELMDGLLTYTEQNGQETRFGARVFKISRDEKGARLTWMKVTGGRLTVKDNLIYISRSGPEEGPDRLTEKANQIRIYSGNHFDAVKEAGQGEICAVTGLSATRPGTGMGFEMDVDRSVIVPVMQYRILFPRDVDAFSMLPKMRELEEEDPMLHISWDKKNGEIHVMLMGEIQIEILKKRIWERFHTAVDFGAGRVLYRETIADTVEGVGHFEPLRHYAEVHLLMEPGERGSGLQFFTACSEDLLDRNWQRLILTHLEEKEHLGVLTGSPITDIQITLVSGKAHLKHTEGGDFRQATYRAVRNGLKKARTVLLEPWYEFRIEMPSDSAGRVMADIQKMNGTFRAPEQDGDVMILSGRAPAAKIGSYQKELYSFTHGNGKISLDLSGYEPCPEQDEIAAEIGYDSELDQENPTGSVFCSHGAGFVVPWYEVGEYMHLEYLGELSKEEHETEPLYVPSAARDTGRDFYAEEKELKAIFERTYGKGKRPEERTGIHRRDFTPPASAPRRKPAEKRDQYLLVDGYNVIFGWEDLRDLAKTNMHAAADRLKEILSNYQGSRQCTLILVFDAYKVPGHKEEVIRYHNIYIVYTREAETADQYIERTVHSIGKKNDVTVATSDGMEQIIIFGQGARRISAEGLRKEIESEDAEVQRIMRENRKKSTSFLMENIGETFTKQQEGKHHEGKTDKKGC